MCIMKAPQEINIFLLYGTTVNPGSKGYFKGIAMNREEVFRKTTEIFKNRVYNLLKNWENREMSRNLAIYRETRECIWGKL